MSLFGNFAVDYLGEVIKKKLPRCSALAEQFEVGRLFGQAMWKEKVNV